jgi:hypothetical protein
VSIRVRSFSLMKLAKLTAAVISTGLTLATLSGCSSSATTGKQLGSKTPCDLISPQDIATLTGTPAPTPHPVAGSTECSYMFHDGLSMEIASGSVTYAPGGAKTAVKGYRATEIKFAGGATCTLDVSLSKDDPGKHFSIRTNIDPEVSENPGNTICALNKKIAAKIIDSLPGK